MSEPDKNNTPHTEPDSAPLTDHEYDGIREYDNPTPGWWSWMFFGSFVFSVLYFMAYQLGTAGSSVVEAYESDVQAVNMRMVEQMGELVVDEATILRFLKGDQKGMIGVGNGIFKQNCATCHGANAQGLTGPNLTDEYFKNVKTLGDIGKVVQTGVSGTAMLGWDGRMHPNEIVMVSAYVASLRGENLDGPLGAQGDEIAPWPDAPPVTSGEAVETP